MIVTDNVLCYCYGNYPKLLYKLYQTHTTDATSMFVMGDMAIETKRVSSQPVPL